MLVRNITEICIMDAEDIDRTLNSIMYL